VAIRFLSRLGRDGALFSQMEGAPIPIRPLAEPAPARAATPLEAIFRQYSRYVAAIAMRLLGRDDEVDDVVQEVFLAAMKGVEQLREPEAVKGWLATVTVRIASRRLRVRRMRSFLRLDQVPGYEAVAPGANPEEKALLSRVYAVLDEMPVNHRVAWTLRHVEGQQLEQVAALCGCSLATAKRRISAAHETIERMLNDE
jgi:RNA polymerase sigma-70 factor (ECF subfamily)